MTWKGYLFSFKTALETTPTLPHPHPPLSVNLPTPSVPPVLVHLPVDLPASQQEFHEDIFKETLKNMKNSKSSIIRIVTWCIKHREAGYKIVRSIDNVIMKVEKNQRLTLFYLIHELALESSKQKLDLNRRLGKLICELLSRKINIVPISKINKCLSIWKRSLVFNKEVLARLDEVSKENEEYIDLVESPGAVASSSSGVNRYGSSVAVAGPSSVEPSDRLLTGQERGEKSRESIDQANVTPMSLDLRLRRDFNISLEMDDTNLSIPAFYTK
jgi:hypothetical protein